MIVIYGSFEIRNPDRVGFDTWYTDLVEVARREEGCVAYDYLIDPQRPERGTIVEIWESPEALAGHMVHPGHVEMLALGAAKWDMTDVRVHFWTEAEGHEFSIRESPDVRVEGRGDLYERIDAFKDEYFRTTASS
jgi:quinol monooxygenase YgiN